MNIQNKDGNTYPMLYLITLKKECPIELLKDYNINLKNSNGNTYPMLYLKKFNKEYPTELMKDYNINLQNNDGNTYPMLYLINFKKECSEKLLKNYDINIQNNKDENYLTLYLKIFKKEYSGKLLENCVDDVLNNYQMIKIITLKKPLDKINNEQIYYQNYYGETIFMFYAKYLYLDFFEYHGIKYNNKNTANTLYAKFYIKYLKKKFPYDNINIIENFNNNKTIGLYYMKYLNQELNNHMMDYYDDININGIYVKYKEKYILKNYIKKQENLPKYLTISCPKEDNCAICQEILLRYVAKLDCGHYYHTYCINDYFKTSKICPICRCEFI